MIEHVYRRAAAAATVDAVGVATDDNRIAEAVTAFGGHAIMTGRHHVSGSDRIAEVARDLDCDVVVNVQGDEPLLDPGTIDAAVAPLLADPAVQMSTICAPLTDAEDFASPHVVKAVVDQRGDALYFSRAPVPYPRQPGATPLRHIGLYAYRRPFLLEFAGWAPTPLEQTEALEQLRALERGVRIRTVVTPCDSIGVDTPDDLTRVRAVLERRLREQP